MIPFALLGGSQLTLIVLLEMTVTRIFFTIDGAVVPNKKKKKKSHMSKCLICATDIAIICNSRSYVCKQ